MVVEPKVAASAPFNVDLHVDEYLEKANKKIAKYRSTHTTVPVPKRMFKKNPNKNRSVPYYYLTRWFSSTPYTIWLYPDDYCTLLFACTNGKCEVYLLDSYASTDYHEKLGEFVKKAIAFVVSIFRKIVEFFKKLITKIKDFFRKIFSSDKVSKDAFGAPVTHAAFSVSGSSASLNKISAKDWEAMRKITQEGCETISKEIDRLEKEQLKNMKDLEQYSAKQAQTVSESASPSMDRLIALIL